MSIHIALILDSSGSMQNLKETAVESYNELVQQAKQDAKKKDIRVSLITFDQDVYKHFWRESADELKLATEDSFKPGGTTALQDALGYTCERALEKDDEQVFINVISDGKENASHKYDKSQVLELVENRPDNWELNYIGCEADWIEQEYEISNTVQVNMASPASFKTATHSMTNSISKSYGGAGDSYTTCEEEEKTDVFGEWEIVN